MHYQCTKTVIACSAAYLLKHCLGTSGGSTAWITITVVAVLLILVIIVTCVLSFIVYKRKKNQRNTSREDRRPCSISDSNIPTPSHQSSAADTLTSQISEPANDGEPEYVSITTVTLAQQTADPNTSTDRNMIRNKSQVSNDSVNVPMTHNNAYGILVSTHAGAINNRQDNLGAVVSSAYEDDYEPYY